MFLRFHQILGISLECAHSVFRVCSECVQSVFRVCSECVQSMFRVCSILKSFHHLAHLVCQFLANLTMLDNDNFLKAKEEGNIFQGHSDVETWRRSKGLLLSNETS